MNSPIYYIPEAKAQPNFHQNQPNYYQGQPQPNPYQNQPNYQQSQPNYQQNQPNYYQNQNQPSGQQYQQNYSQQPNYQQKQYNTQPSQPNLQQYQPSYQQNQPIPQQTQPSTQQYQQTYPQQQNVYQNQPNYGQTQPNVQQNQQSTPQNQPTIPQGLSSFPLAESNYIQQPTSQQIQPTIQQSQQNVQQSQQNVQQYQPNVSQQPNPYQNQSTYPQTQPDIQQNQPTTQQNQPTVQQENLNITLDSFAPLQNTNTNMAPNTNMGPSQMLPNNNMAPSQMLPNTNMGPSQMLSNANFNMAPSQMLPSNQANKFGISISITGENTYQEESIAYTLYNIQGYSQKGQFSTAKGYLDFVNVQFLLTVKFPGCKKYLEIPDKTLFLKLDNSQNEARKRGLENFLKFVGCSQELFYSTDFQTFLATQAYSAKQQIEYLRKHNPFIMYNNPALQQDVNIDIVKEYEKTDGLLLKHREYVIQGSDQKGQFMVSRRYKDFVKIREILVAKFPGVPFLHLPSVTSQNTPERTQGLITFLRSIPKTPFAYQSTEWQLFIRYAEPDFKKKLKPFHKTQSVLKTILK